MENMVNMYLMMKASWANIHINEKTHVAAVLAQLKEYIPCAAGRIPGNVRVRMFSPRDRASSAFIKFLFMTEMCQGK